MRCNIQSAPVPVVTIGGGHLDAEFALQVNGVIARQDAVIRDLAALLNSFGDGFHQRHGFLAQAGEDGAHIFCFQSRIEIVQQRVIRVIVKALQVRLAP